jgi:hypothetical protein
MARILLHTCCGPCTLYPLRLLRDKGHEVTGFFYNANIQPLQEFQRRLAALREVAAGQDLRLIVREDYELEEFLRQVVFRESRRCHYCYAHRLEATARLARKSGYDAFSTTLFFSTHQDHDLIRAIASAAADRVGVALLYEDFRVGWREGQAEARNLGIYRQQYCGCIYSEKARYLKTGRRGQAGAEGCDAS